MQKNNFGHTTYGSYYLNNWSLQYLKWSFSKTVLTTLLLYFQKTGMFYKEQPFVAIVFNFQFISSYFLKTAMMFCWHLNINSFTSNYSELKAIDFNISAILSILVTITDPRTGTCIVFLAHIWNSNKFYQLFKHIISKQINLINFFRLYSSQMDQLKNHWLYLNCLSGQYARNCL